MTPPPFPPKKPPVYDGEPLWPSVDDSNKYPTPVHLRAQRTPPIPSLTEDDDVSQMLVPSADVYYIREELHRLSKDKADKSAISSLARALETRMDTLSTQIEKSAHCLRENDFAELKDAVNTWRMFFRNTIAVGSVGALFVVGGWLWQFYSLSSQVHDTAEEVSSVNRNVAAMQDDYQKYKRLAFETETRTTHEFNTKLVMLEYKLLSAMSQMSQGHQIAAPAPPPVVVAPTE